LVLTPIEQSMNKLCPMPGCRVEQVMHVNPDLLHIAAHGMRPGGRCPDCGRASRAVHSTYRRHPADLPSLGRAVRIDLEVRRFSCRNSACARRTFAEQPPELVVPHARRTRRLAETQVRLGLALSGRGAAHLLAHLAMPASADTVLRLVRRLPLPAQERPRIIGVDDWAMRKGRTYGTIVVGLERRRVLDLLPDSAAETLAAWLRAHPGIEAVARDRSTEYARGITLGAPAATQVADRWHLLANMRQVLERWLAGAQARLRGLPLPPSGPEPDAVGAVPRQTALRTQPFPRSAAEMASRRGRRERRIALYEKVRRRRAAGETWRSAKPWAWR
jgi:transposase